MSSLTVRDHIGKYFALFKRKINLLIRRLSSEKVLAVYDDELDGILEKLGIIDKIDEGSIHCFRCKCMITRENLGVIKNENGVIQIFCMTTFCNKKTDND